MPDLRRERASGEGWVGIAEGSLFDGGTVGWKGLTLLDQGVDIEFEFSRPYFISRLLIDASALRSAGSVSVWGEKPWRQVGQSRPDLLDSDAFRYQDPGPAWVDLGKPLIRGRIRLASRFADLVLEGGLSWVALESEPVDLFPYPTAEHNQTADTAVRAAGADGQRSEPSVRATGSVGLTATDIIGIELPEGDAESQAAADYFIRRMDEDFGSHLIREKSTDPLSFPDGAADHWIVLRTGFETRDPAIPAPYGADPEQFLNGLSDGGFSLTVRQTWIIVRAASRLGLIAGLSTVMRFWQTRRHLPEASFTARPGFPFRGVHLPLPSPEQVPFFRFLIESVVLPLRYNAVILEFAGGMRFRSHPEINTAWEQLYLQAKAGLIPMPAHFDMVAPGSCIEAEAVRDLVDWIRGFGLDVIPEVQSLSHVQYLTAAHPELAEIAAPHRHGFADRSGKPVDYRQEDVPPPEDIASCYCPSIPESRQILDDLLDEILEVVRPRGAVHMGHDEVYRIGVCARCRDRDPAELLAEDLLHWHSRLAARGLRMMIWADMLQSRTAYRTPAALARLPRDIVMLDFIWYFDLASELEDRLLEHGFPVLFGNLYSSHFQRYARRSQKQGVMGGQLSTWVSNSEAILGREGKFYDLAYTAGWLWQACENPHLRPARSLPVQRWLTAVRRQAAGHRPNRSGGTAIQLLDEPARPLSDPLLRVLSDVLSSAADYLEDPDRHLYPSRGALALPDGAAEPAGDSVRTATIAIRRRLSTLRWVHACRLGPARVVWKDLPVAGCYRIVFENGDECRIPLTGGGNIMTWNRRYAQPLPTNYYRHQGYTGTYFADPIFCGFTPEDSPVTLLKLEWFNPDPTVLIDRLIVEADPESDAGILLFSVIGEEAEPNTGP